MPGIVTVAIVPILLAAAAALPVSAATVLPDFGDATFIDGAQITNPYLPWEVGARSAQVARGVADGEPFEERDVQTVLGRGPKILGVRTIAVLDKGFEDGVLAEKTFDYYAQDTDGNVWYMGEDSTAFEYDDEGKLIGKSTEGSWRAGRRHALPGYAMPASLAIGFQYYQEFAPKDEALDQARTFAILEALSVGGKSYANVLQVLETTKLEPDSRELKYYAPGVGLIRVEEGLDENLANPEAVFNRVEVAAVPLPPGLLLLGGGLVCIAALRRRACR